MNFYEWEIAYIVKLIKAKEKALSKNEYKKSSFVNMRMQRELDALQTIFAIVTSEAEHLHRAMKGERR